MPAAVVIITPGECTTVGPTFEVHGTYSAPDTMVTECCLKQRPGGTTCVVAVSNFSSGSGTFNGTFTGVALGDYFIEATGNMGGKDTADITVSNTGIGGKCHRIVAASPPESDDGEDGNYKTSILLDTLTVDLGCSDDDSEAIVEIGVSTHVLQAVTFKGALPAKTKVVACKLGDYLPSEIDNTDGKWSVTFKDIALGSYVLRVIFDNSSKDTLPVEVVNYVKTQESVVRKSKRAVKA
jgi:hypothetical protein